MEQRLINATELYEIEKLLSTAAKTSESKVLMEQVLFDIENTPTIDAVPIVHRKWIWKQDLVGGQNRLRCQECDKECLSKNNYYVESEYCPSCGAKMDIK